LIGRDIENGLIPNDEKLVGPMIRNICYANARQYMAFPLREPVARRKQTA
jgi:glucuronate isomerase